MKILPPEGSRLIYFTILISLGSILLFLFYPLLPIGGPFGHLRATRDIKNGHLALRISGLWNYGHWKKWKTTLREQYNIDIDGPPSACLSGGFSRTYDQAYNSTQMQEILRLYGRNVVEEARLRAYEEEKKAAR